jgi:CRISPR-associated protein Cas2
MKYSGYRLLWLQVLFDLPVTEKQQRKDASDFRNYLLDLGFSMAQFSVYMRHCKGKDEAETLVKKVEKQMPSDGTVHILIITDKQYESIKTFYCGVKSRLKNPDQLLLF